eukprot:snap_masked-scaffold_18-processed-gene-6.35-mRNA-1 protein AED:1.00 eAED:1.00 QI:0/0/0/0/1/1/2/0/71
MLEVLIPIQRTQKSTTKTFEYPQLVLLRALFRSLLSSCDSFRKILQLYLKANARFAIGKQRKYFLRAKIKT